MKVKKFVEKISLVLISVCLLTLFTYVVYGAIPQTINYQGYLTDASGVPVNQTVQITFGIYNVPSGGSALWTETQSVTVTQGVYNVELGGVTPIGLAFDIPYYLGVKVGADSEMTPRIVLTSVGYAYRAKTVESVGSHTHSGADITTGTVSEARIDSTIARDSEVTAAVNAHALRTDNPHSTTASQVGAVALGQPNSVTSGMIADGTIMNADIASSAAIDISKLSGVASLSHNHDATYVNVTGDTMTGPLNVNHTGSTSAAGVFWNFDTSNSTAALIVGNEGGPALEAVPNSGSAAGTFWGNLLVGNYESTLHGFDSAIALRNFAPGGGYWYLRSGATGTATPEGGFSIADDAAYRLAIDRNGNVGIGRTDPLYRLDVAGGSARLKSDTQTLLALDAMDGGGRLWWLNAATAASGSAIGNGFGLYDWSASAYRFVVDPNGNIGIGVNTPFNPLQMGSGAHVTAGGVWTNASSRAYKENIRDLTPEEAKMALDELKPVRFNYKTNREEEHLGFIAEDVPDLVASNDRKGISPMDIVALLTRVVKEQQMVIEELKGKISEIDSLKTQLSELGLLKTIAITK